MFTLNNCQIKSLFEGPSDCVVSVPSRGDNMPIPLGKTNTGESSVIYPDKNGKFIIRHTKELRMSCAGSKFKSPKDFDVENVIVTCLNGSFVHFETKYEFDQFKCKNNPTPKMVVTETTCQVPNTRIIEVGFMTVFGFKTLYKLCFNMDLISSVYAWYFVDPPVNNFRQKSDLKPTIINPRFKNHADSDEILDFVSI